MITTEIATPETTETPKADEPKAPKAPKAAKAKRTKKDPKKAKAPKKSAKPKAKKSKALKGDFKVAKPTKIEKGGKLRPGSYQQNPKSVKNLGVVGSGQKGKHSMTREDGRRAAGTRPPIDDAAARYGARVRKARKAKELTQYTLAAKLKMGQPSIANIERGIARASEEVQAKLAKALGL